MVLSLGYPYDRIGYRNEVCYKGKDEMTKGKKEGEGGCLIRVFRITKNTTEKVAT
jgi:hypothetical protein